MKIKKLKIMTIVGTRPEIIRLSRVMAKLDEYCEHVMVHTGQNYDYELNQIFYDDLGIRKPNHFLACAENSQSAANTIGNIIMNQETGLSPLSLPSGVYGILMYLVCLPFVFLYLRRKR